MQVIDPSTGEAGQRYETLSGEQLEAKLDLARGSFEQWRETDLPHRAELLTRLARSLRSQARHYAELMAREMGKPITQGLAEIDKCAWVCEHYAQNGPRLLAREPVETDASESFVSAQPLGPIFAIMPWNFPFWQLFRHAAPGLMAGNTILLKHAGNVPGCALAIEEMFRDAGALDGLMTTLLIDHDQSAQVIRDRRVCGVTITGSTRAGRSVGAAAGEALKKVVLELGGSDAYVILEDADLAQAASVCAKSRLINSGQSCIAAKRFIVAEPVRERFEELFVEAMRGARVGSPLEEATEVGPQAREDLREDLHRQVIESVEAGARVLLGGQMPSGPGFFYPPSVLTDVREGMAAFDEEVFGPVAAIVPARDEEQAIALANHSVYGLGAAVFTADLERGRHIAEHRLHAGNCFVNGLVKSDPRLPFGGVGDSGHGRELGRPGILEFVNLKTVWVA